MKEAKFTPAIQDGDSTSAWITKGIDFKLTEKVKTN
jgi:hypothetical protein